jgi:hypothetical protein
MQHAKTNAIPLKRSTSLSIHRKANAAVCFPADCGIPEKIDASLLVLAVVGDLESVSGSLNLEVGQERQNSAPVAIPHRDIDPPNNVPVSIADVSQTPVLKHDGQRPGPQRHLFRQRSFSAVVQDILGKWRHEPLSRAV